MSQHAAADLEFLLDRPIRRLLTPADRRAFAGRRVLITGAGGSIGSELARQIAACGPEQLVLLDQCELNLFQIERELQERHPGIAIEPVLADVTRRVPVRQVFRATRPHVVYHAAAYKHVTMVERAVCAAVTVNVFGTLQVLAAAQDTGARFVLISSDKAAEPRSVMGATKRLAELAVLREAGACFSPIVVRFGNVLGSSGSLLTILRERIRAGRPLPVTDLEATRYFMSAGEAVSLVMKAELFGSSRKTYWLDMGDPVRIGDLIERLLRLEAASGFAPVPIEIIGLRPGEKLRETLADQGLAICRTRHPRIWVARQREIADERIAASLRSIRRAVAIGNAARALREMTTLMPEFVVSAEAQARAHAQALVLTGIEKPRVARSA